MKKIITIKESINIDADRNFVWDFTQDFNNRQNWDSSILEYKILETEPTKLVWIRTSGGISTKLRYKLFDKANKTSLSMIDTKSFLIHSGGGSWSYKTEANSTKWTQVNSLVIKNYFWYFLLGWLIKIQLRRNTRISMQSAKKLIENLRSR